MKQLHHTFYRFLILLYQQKGLVCLCTLLLVAIGCSGNVPDDLVEIEQPSGIIFVKANRTRTLNGFASGGNLYSLIPASPDGKLTNLTKLENGDVADPEISYDGLRVLFSMRTSRSQSFDIYEMNIDGTNLRQLSQDSSSDDFDPTYLPNGKILFTSNRPGFVDEYNKASAEVLHVMETNGSNVECISFNNSDDFDPMVMADGRVIYTRWDHHGQINRFPLFFTHPDGHGTFTFFSPHSAGMFFHAREMPDGSVAAIRSSMVNGDSGPVVFIKDFSTAGEPLLDGALENITPEITLSDPYENGAFKYPFPLPDGRLMVSYSQRYGTWVDENENIIEEVEPDYGLYTMNVDGSGLTLLYNDLESQEYDAVVIDDRPMPPVIPSDLDKSANNGVFTVENVYFRQRGDGQEIPNMAIQEAKQVMLIEGLPRMKGDRGEIGLTEFEQKRIIGTAPIEADGSFSIRVPANIPLSFNVLDSLGRAIVSKRNWMTVRPGEQFEKCSGCHSPRGQSSGNPDPIAGNRPPTDLTTRVAEPDVSFSYAIEPIIEAKCQGCHSGTSPPGDLELTVTKDPEHPLFSIAYTSLVGDMDEETEGRQNEYIREPFSRRSKLIDILLGLGNSPLPTRHPSDAFTLSDEEVQKFMNWVDLGAQYR